jgi:hypothetical protein
MQDFRYPGATEESPLEYDWEGYESVTIVYTPDSLERIEKFYVERFGLENELPEDGKLEFQFGEDGSALFADVKEKEAVEDLDSYVSSKRLKKLGRNRAGTIGVFFRKAQTKK